MSAQELILASRSPRRAEFLKSLGLGFSVQSPDILEDQLPGENASDYALRLAREKCAKVSAQFPSAAVLAADTVVVRRNQVGEQTYGKPENPADAARMLGELQGTVHYVLTAFCLRSGLHDEVSRVVESEVEFVPLSAKEIARYVATGEPMDKAGSYAIQGLAARFVRRVTGSYTNIVGLPLAEVYEALQQFGVVPEASA